MNLLEAYRISETDNGDFQVIATFENPEKVFLKFRNDQSKAFVLFEDTQWLCEKLFPLLDNLQDVLTDETEFEKRYAGLAQNDKDSVQKILKEVSFKAVNSYGEEFFALADIHTALRRAIFLGFFDPQKQFPHIDFEVEKQALHSAENFGSHWVIQDHSERLDEGFYNLSSGFAMLDELCFRAYQMSFSRHQVRQNPAYWEIEMMKNDLENKFDKVLYWDNPAFLLIFVYPILQKAYPYQDVLQVQGVMTLSDAQLPDAFWQSLTEDEKEVAKEIADNIPVTDWAVICEMFKLAEKIGFLQFVKQTDNSNHPTQLFTFQKP